MRGSFYWLLLGLGLTGLGVAFEFSLHAHPVGGLYLIVGVMVAATGAGRFGSRSDLWVKVLVATAVGIILGQVSGPYLAYPVARVAVSIMEGVNRINEGVNRINRSRVIKNYLDRRSPHKLQIGAGTNDPEGWLNSDIEPTSKEIYLDATKPFPFPGGSFQYVFAEHVIEHVPWEGALNMLKESHRILSPGGKVRIVTPDVARFLVLFGPAMPGGQEYITAKLRLHGWPQTPVPAASIFNHEVRDWGHQFLYDPATLRKTLELAGFQDIKQFPVTEATDPVFREAELRTRHPGSDLYVVNAWEAMAFEATK